MANRKLLYLSFILNIAFCIVACAHKLSGTPVWNGKLWAGDPGSAQVVRTQDPPPNVVSAFDPAFKDMVCMTYEDLSCMYFSFVNNCKDWYTLKPSCPKVSKTNFNKYLKSYENYAKKAKK